MYKSWNILLFLGWGCTIAAQQFVYAPAQPVPGDTITITYDPGAGPLEGVDTIGAELYYLGETEPVALELPLSKKGGGRFGRFVAGTKDKAFLVSFYGDDRRDNGDEGYHIYLYDTTGKPIRGALAARAEMLYLYNDAPEMPSRPGRARDLLRRELALYGQNRRDPVYLRKYYQACEAAGDSTELMLLADFMRALDPAEWMSEKQLEEGFKLCSHLVLSDQQWDYGRLLRKKFDNDLSRYWSDYQEFRYTWEMDQRLRLYDRVARHQTDQSRQLRDEMAAELALDFLSYDNYEGFVKYVQDISSAVERASWYHHAAGKLISDDRSIIREEDLQIAQSFGETALKIIQESINTPVNRPSRYTARRWVEVLANTFGWYADTYAQIRHKQGYQREALRYQQIASELLERAQAAVNDRLVSYNTLVHGEDSSAVLLRQLLESGHFTADMRNRFVEFYGNRAGPPAVARILSRVDSAKTAPWKAWYRGRLLNLEAPGFLLEDPDGSRIALQGLRGKTVVLYFWATDCEPCTDNFDALQLLQERHAADPDRVFLYISTLEYTEREQAAVQLYLREHPYPFKVLLDPNDETAKTYGLTALPAVALIDPAGKLRMLERRDVPKGMELYYALQAVMELLEG